MSREYSLYYKKKEGDIVMFGYIFCSIEKLVEIEDDIVSNIEQYLVETNRYFETRMLMTSMNEFILELRIFKDD
jgi:hypothetical protein